MISALALNRGFEKNECEKRKIFRHFMEREESDSGRKVFVGKSEGYFRVTSSAICIWQVAILKMDTWENRTNL